MRASTLPSPGHLRISQQLRILAAQAISAAERRGQVSSDGTSPELLAFFNACAAAVTAAAPKPALTGIDSTPATVTLANGATSQIATTAVPPGATLPTLTYVSSAPAIATVSATGLITKVTAGTATITVTGGGFTDTVVVS